MHVHGDEELRGNRPLSAMVGSKRPVGGGGSPALSPNPRLSQQARLIPENRKRKRVDNGGCGPGKKRKAGYENEGAKKRKREEDGQETETKNYHKKSKGDREGKPRAGVG